MTARIITVSIPVPKTPEQRVQEYVDRIERKRARDEARTIRRCQKFADDLWNMALGAGTMFFAFAAALSIFA